MKVSQGWDGWGHAEANEATALRVCWRVRSVGTRQGSWRGSLLPEPHSETFGVPVTTGLHKWDTVCIYSESLWDYGHCVGVLLKMWSVNMCFKIFIIIIIIFIYFFLHLLWIYGNIWHVGRTSYFCFLWWIITNTACVEIYLCLFCIYLFICIFAVQMFWYVCNVF